MCVCDLCYECMLYIYVFVGELMGITEASDTDHALSRTRTPALSLRYVNLSTSMYLFVISVCICMTICTYHINPSVISVCNYM